MFIASCSNITTGIRPQFMVLKSTGVRASTSIPKMELSYKGPKMSQFLNDSKKGGKQQSLTVIGHRGYGQNLVVSNGDPTSSRTSVMENTVKSLVLAAENGADFVEFDVQVTKDGHAVIFHDDYIVVDNKGYHDSKRIAEITLEEYLSLGYQEDGVEIQRPLVRNAKDGTVLRWFVNVEDRLCTLKDAFVKVPVSVGFNIELKFDDEMELPDEVLQYSIATVLKEVEDYGRERKIFFSTFHPDAVSYIRKMQTEHPVLFLTDGGTTIYKDERRNSVDSAISVCLENGLQGIVCEAEVVLHNPDLVTKVKEAELSLLTYGKLNNYIDTLQKQQKAGIDGVIVDHVLEMIAALRSMSSHSDLTISDNVHSLDMSESVKAAA